MKKDKVESRPCSPRCRLQRTCPGFEWYPASDVQFCRHQCIFIIEHMELLVEGTWPRDPVPTGYSDAAGIKPQPRPRAPYETPCQIAGEVEYRLSRTGKDGLILRYAVLAHVLYNEYPPEARDALNYVSGWRRRHIPYRQWKYDRARGRYQKYDKMSTICGA